MKFLSLTAFLLLFNLDTGMSQQIQRFPNQELIPQLKDLFIIGSNHDKYSSIPDSLNFDGHFVKHMYYVEGYDSDYDGNPDIKLYFSFDIRDIISDADESFPYKISNPSRPRLYHIAANIVSYSPRGKNVTYTWTFDKSKGVYNFKEITK